MCKLYRKRFGCGCQYDEWTYCYRPTPAMMPTTMNRLGNGCAKTTNANQEPTIIEYANCCKLLCCSSLVHGVQLQVRAAQRFLGVEGGKREGLDFAGKEYARKGNGKGKGSKRIPALDFATKTSVEKGKEIVWTDNAVDILRDRQMLAFKELQKHKACRKVLKRGEEGFKGVMTPKREKLGVGPWEDNDVKQQKWKIFNCFAVDNEMRIKRAERKLRELEEGRVVVFERPKFETKEDEERFELYEKQTRELMEWLERQERKFEERGVPDLEPRIKIIGRAKLRDGKGIEEMVFQMEMDE